MFILLRRLSAFVLGLIGLFVLFYLLVVSKAGAQEAGNVFGIHITDKEDIPLAAKLVNGESGEWGYVTIVIQSNDRSYDKWQPIFYDLMKYKLQPIVRIATKIEGGGWARPTEDDAQLWAEFLNSLYWPTDRRIVSIYNEVNHGTEWGGATDPAGYAKELDKTIDALKNVSQSFFVLHAAFDQATPQQPPRHMDAGQYMQEMDAAVPGIFNKLDGWASHSYPNPGFAGSPKDAGKATIRGYAWELELLRTRFGVTRELPVFIKETGWVYRDAAHPNLKYKEEEVVEFMAEAFEQVWLKDPRVVAVTPFILRYPESQFSHFSWIRPDGNETEIFKRIAAIPKMKGSPARSFRAKLERVAIPSKIPLQREIGGLVTYKNTGSRPWSSQELVRLTVDDPQRVVVRDNFLFEEDFTVMPGQAYSYRFMLKAASTERKIPISLQMSASDEVFSERLFVPLEVYTPPTIALQAINVPQNEPLPQAVIGMKDARGQTHQFEPVQLLANGRLGNFEHPMFVPDVPLNIVIAMPQREQVSLVVTPKAGVNELQFSLPDRKSRLALLAESFVRALRRTP